MFEAAAQSSSFPTSTIISITALAFSFGTTFVSYRRTKAQDVQALRQELRGILQRLSAIPRENLDASRKYAGDQNALQAMSQLYGQENALLSRQAAEISRRLPPGMVSATEYAEIAMTLQNAYNLNGAKEFFQFADDRATDFNDKINAVRSLANLDFVTGAPEGGRLKYRQALDIFATYPGYDPYTQATTHVLTHLFWGQAEASAGNLPLALDQIASAQQILATLPFSPGADGLRRQVTDQGLLFEQGSTRNAAGPGSVYPPPASAPASSASPSRPGVSLVSSGSGRGGTLVPSAPPASEPATP